MNDILTPDEVRGMGNSGLAVDERLCQDYLTLWDELANERSISDRLLERIAELERAVATARRGGMDS